MSDEINSPSHYMLFPGMESIDVIKAALTPEEFKGFCKGNALKYRLRAGDKGPAEKCIAKANWYQNRLRDMVEDVISDGIAETMINLFAGELPKTEEPLPLNRCPGCVKEDCPCLPV